MEASLWPIFMGGIVEFGVFNGVLFGSVEIALFFPGVFGEEMCLASD